MTKVIKRDCSLVEFDDNKIFKAIMKAMKNGSGIVKPKIAEDIAKEIYEECKNKDEVSISEIENLVFDKLITKKQRLTAKAYEGYRKIREFQRDNENTIDMDIIELLNDKSDYWKNENANKNPMLNTTKRDYMAGIVSTDATRRYLLPPEIVQAHDDGTLHFHDADYFAQYMHNCFHKNTKFYTSNGIKSFADFHDGDIVRVIDKNGEFKTATVKNYGKQSMNKIVFTTAKRTKTVICTNNHRWLLKDGTITTNLKVGDTLLGIQEKINETPSTIHEAEMFTLGFLVGDGCDHDNGAGYKYHQIRLCGHKIEYAPIIEKAGYKLSSVKNSNDLIAVKAGLEKQDFLNNHAWKYFNENDKKWLFIGLYSANGSVNTNKLCTTDDRVMDLIRETSYTSGYYITSETVETRDTQYKKDSEITAFRFTKNQPNNLCWKVQSIIPYHNGTEYETWCVEEPTTHSFMLDGGMITGNCDLINLEDMLQNGTVISEVLIEKPHSFSTACTVTTQIIAQVASSQYGGQSISLAHLAPFVDVSRQKIRKEVEQEFSLVTETYIEENSVIDSIVKKRLKKEITKGIQTIQYQLTTLMTTNGQAPFITIFMYLNEANNEQEKKDLAMLIEEMLKQRIEGVKNEEGVFIAPAFPKLIYVTEEDNITEDAPYWYLTILAAECSAKRLVPDYISEKMMLKLKGDVYTCMGCRSFLTPDRFTDNGIGNIANAKNYAPNKHKYYGRFNQGVVTINLPDIAFSSEGDFDKFWDLFEERTELCHKALRLRHERLLGTPSDVSPILWKYGALARLKKGEVIDKLLYDGYSTISLGYAGLYECVKYMTGHSHSDEGGGEKFGLNIMNKLNDKCRQWKESENIDYSIYGTPLESTTYKFAKKLKERFGDDIFIKLDNADRNYITNSYHIPVFEPIDAFEKLRIESKFQKLSPGGAISYIETPSMLHNIPALLEVIKYMYEHIMYAEINTKSCYCEKCGYDGDITLINNNGKLVWHCPNCGNEDASTMDIAFRVCGYIGTAKNGGNQGRYGDIHDRVKHLDDMEYQKEGD